MFVKSCILSAALSVFVFSSAAHAVVAANNGGGAPTGVSPTGTGEKKETIEPRSVRGDRKRAAAARGMVLSDDICTGGKYVSCEDNRAFRKPSRP